MQKRELTYRDALREALREEMKRDKNVFLIGEDIGVIGGNFKVTQGLLNEFGPERVMDTPISENAIVGAAVGAGIMGMRPVAEIMYADFVCEAMDQLVNHMPKIRFMTGGKLRVPTVIRTQFALYRYAGGQHSQCFPVFFTNTPGLYVAVPSTPYDAKGLLKSAIRDDNPVIFCEAADLYARKGPVPEEEYTIPLGNADIKREGKDVTVFAFLDMVYLALKIADELEKEGISVEVLDPRTLVPLDREKLINSIKKTGRLVIIEPDPKSTGVGAEISSIAVEEVFEHLKAPVKRIGAMDMPAPMSPPLYNNFMPAQERVIKAIKEIVEK